MVREIIAPSAIGRERPGARAFFCYDRISTKMFDEADASIPSISVPSEGPMEVPSFSAGVRRNEDIALDLMKFIAMTTGYGRTSSAGVGFQGGGAAAKPDEYAAHLLELYARCVDSVSGKK